MNEVRLPKRKNKRLKDFDYSSCETYFITICTKDQQKNLSRIVGSPIGRPSVKLTNYGVVVDEAINSIEIKYDRIILENYVIMPDHVHLMLSILPDESGRPMGNPTIPNVINQLKGYASKKAGFSLWQKSYYDHIIRDQIDYEIKWQYISNNPASWLEKQGDEK